MAPKLSSCTERKSFWNAVVRSGGGQPSDNFDGPRLILMALVGQELSKMRELGAQKPLNRFASFLGSQTDEEPSRLTASQDWEFLSPRSSRLDYLSTSAPAL
jgi:hypothetical protein